MHGRPPRQPSRDDARRQQDGAGHRFRPLPRRQFACLHNCIRPVSLQDNGRGAAQSMSVMGDFGIPATYSLFRAFKGEMDAALLAGMIAAKNAEIASALAAIVRAKGSQLETP